MARRRTVTSCVGDTQSKSGDDEKESTRRLNVQISESAFEALMIHLIKLRRPLGDLVTDAIKEKYTEFHIHSNPRRGRGEGSTPVEPDLAEPDGEEDRRDLYSPVRESQAEAA
jgi:hypothetical protein